jgi:hypothetical protein
MTINPSEIWGPPPPVDGFDGDADGCQHIADAFADETLKARITHTFQSAVSWRAQRLHDNIHAPKRRKVRACPAHGPLFSPLIQSSWRHRNADSARK